MAAFTVVSFPRYNGGKCDEYRTAEPVTHTLAYLDYYDDGAECTVFDPSTDWNRTYGRRSVEKARAIIERHLAKLGYTTKDN
jgi:hypothetical protein